MTAIVTGLVVVGGSFLTVALAQGGIVPADNRLGGDLTVVNRTSRAFGLPGPGLSDSERALFLEGDSAFEATFVAGAAPANSGLGPRYNNSSCVACHVGDGRGAPVIGTGPRRSVALVRVSLAPEVTDAPNTSAGPELGPQIRDHATFGFTPDGTVSLAWDTFTGAYADGTSYELRSPRVTITLPDGRPLPQGLLTSLRTPPPAFGRGLLEVVPVETILALSDADDNNGDGISGRPNWVRGHESGEPELGRFGVKANTATLREQTAAAYANDMGVSSPVFPNADGAEEVSEATLQAVTLYLQTLAVPARRSASREARLGEEHFMTAGCAACHTPSLQTGESPIASLAYQSIYPFTDLLLHDMGDGLADGRPDFDASGREWRTPPLWGIGLTETVLTATPAFLHDGRARSLSEAILWHGGEAEGSREWFRTTSEPDRAALLAFLKSL